MRTRILYCKINSRRTFPTNMLVSLVTNNKYLTAVNMGSVTENKYQIPLYNMEYYLIYKKHFPTFLLAIMSLYFS